MAGNYMRVIPQTYTDAVALPANTTPVVIPVDAIFCETAGTVTVVTAQAGAAIAQGNTDPDGASHAIAMLAGQLLPLACTKITGDGTFVGLGLVL
jgi:hypothetical protein